MAKELPVQRIQELLRYDEETGNLYWKIDRTGFAKIGKVAGSTDKDGYTVVKIDGSLYKAHRVIYALSYSLSSFGEIDHIDGSPDNNRLSNLREVSRNVNQQNNSVRGTFQRKGRWNAQIKANLKTFHLGLFDTEEAAHQAYLEAKKIHHPEARRN